MNLLRIIVVFLGLFIAVSAVQPVQASVIAKEDIALVPQRGDKAARKEFRRNFTLKERIALRVVHKIQKRDKAQGKSQLAAALLCFFLGGLGIHRFYLGYVGIGLIQLFTAGGFWIWSFVDFIRICIGDLGPKFDEYN